MCVEVGMESQDRCATAPSLHSTDSKAKFDELVEDRGVKVLIDPGALLHVLGTKMDYVEDRLRSEFVFVNPNAKGTCGCGESFTTDTTKGPPPGGPSVLPPTGQQAPQAQQ